MLDLKDLQRRMDGTVNALRNDLSGLRTGRASANIVEPLMVDAYGSKMPMNQVANVSVPDARTVQIQVWDTGLVRAVDKAIRDSNLGLNPVIDGQLLRIPMPEMTEDRRKEVVKIANEYTEKARVAARHVRRDGMDQLKKAEKDGEISKDDAHGQSENVQKMTDATIKEIDATLATKETEIMQV
ncbi:MAG: ribosome recycling factor [Pseudomonadota bacterium]